MSGLSALEDDLARLGLTVPPTAVGQLLAFEQLLLKWNKTYNLTAIRDLAGVRIQHLLDSLSILPWVNGERWLDVGSGGGLPGIPLAICCPHIQFTLVDAVQKKVSFLQQAVIELGLKNLQPIHGRVEALDKGTFDRISSRAFAELSLFIQLTRPLLAPGGQWLAMKGQLPTEELAALPRGIHVEQAQPLIVPGLGAERHLIVMTDRGE